MDQTINYGFPYPECDPPLVKDASDIIQLKDLADAVDTEVQTLYDSASQLLVRPDAARMSSPSITDVASPIQNTSVMYTSMTFDNTPGQVMANTTIGAIQFVETGWYMVGHNSIATRNPPGGTIPISIRFLKNGAPVNNWSASSSVDSGLAAQHTVLRFDAGDTLTTEIRMDIVAINWRYTSRIWALQLMAV